MRISFIKYTSAALGFFVLLSAALNASAARTNIAVPTGSGTFGGKVATLPNGNFVVVDSGYDENSISNIGAVYLYNGATLALISTLKGSSTNDNIGSAVTVLPNGNFVVRSGQWNGGATNDVGAVTLCNGVTGCNGTISASNSLVGVSASDAVGGTIVILASGDYVVSSPDWDNGAVGDAGAVTFCSGTTGCTGAVSVANSTVGSKLDDAIGSGEIIPLSGSSYVMRSAFWDNGAATNAGAVTFCTGGTPRCIGAVSASNSLVGTTTNDSVGRGGITPLAGNSYVVSTPEWDNGAVANVGAVTFRSSTTGYTGTITAANSLVGSTASDLLLGSVVELTNGKYVVRSPRWSNGATISVGAVTLCSGTSGCSGAITPVNSLVGSVAQDEVGLGGVTALTNGNYVVSSLDWDNGTTIDAGAVTFCSGTSGRTGVITAANSLVGSTAADSLGTVTPLTNGNYVVSSSDWDNGVTADAGAAIICSGTSGRTGGITAANALIGASPSDFFSSSIMPLTNGNYVVRVPNWDNGAATSAGAATFCNGVNGCNGAISASNSLVGLSSNDTVGNIGRALPNGNYVVGTVNWDNGATINVGAATFCSGTTGCTAAVSASNSLVGSTAEDRIAREIILLTNGNYLITSPSWSNGTLIDTGAITFGNGTTGRVGAISAANSLVGSQANEFLGSSGITPLPNGDYTVFNINFTNGTAQRVGAITYGNAVGGVIGTINAANSFVGTEFINSSAQISFDADNTRRRLIVGTQQINSVAVVSFPAQFDFTADSRAELAVFRPSNGSWYTFNLANNENNSAAFGQAGDVIVPADYDGDMKTDIAVYRGGTWFLQRSALGFTGIGFGAASDIPAPADFDGDGRAELAVFRPSNGTWFTLNLVTGAFNGVAFGQNGDRPVPAEYDADGKSDIAVYRGGTWFIQRSQLGFTGVAFGEAADRCVPADYDGDGLADIAVFRPSNGTWFLLRSTLGFTGLLFGQTGDQPTPADYDGDSKTDLAVYRGGTWFLQRSTTGFTGAAFGASTDLAIPNAYVR